MGSNPIPPTLVFDTSTLQGLHRSGALEILSGCRDVRIPKAVGDETTAYRRGASDPSRAPELGQVPSIRVVEVTDERLRAMGAELLGPYKGTFRYSWRGRELEQPELEAICLALEGQATLVIEDEIAARLAHDVGLQVFSTADVLRALEADERIHDASARASKVLATGYHQADLVQLAGGRMSSTAEAYEPAVVEPKWQQRWQAAGLDRAGRKPSAPKKYVLEMFPYPSGNMHMGHVRNYLIGDVLARYYRTRGFDVLHPFGWDALGLPAENAAIKDQRHPAERTAENIRTFKADTQRLALSYDWEREVNTSDPTYYRWNQWFFIQMLERGIVYRRSSRVNWCPGCATVIANEQVKDDGRCERSGDVVEQREMPEWAFRITAYADQLLAGLESLKEWPDRITSMQRNWIGKSEGAEIAFKLEAGGAIRVFTTRLDTIFGCTYLVLAPEHALVEKIASAAQLSKIRELVAELKSQDAATRTDEKAEKKGVNTGAFAIHPFTGKQVPVWVANFVVATYGTGAVMSVPAHDHRDHAFAKKYALPIVEVIGSTKPDAKTNVAEEAFTDDGVLVNSGAFTGKTSAQARQALTAEAEKQGIGKKTVNFHLRDWGFSRQRYWGTPIPIVYCEKCDPEKKGIPVPLNQLPVKLPDIDVKAVLTGRGEPPLAKVPSFVNTTCPKCGGPARRETETMDTFVDSTWYYARYLNPRDTERPFEKADADRWLPVDVYVGGPEHAVMHLLYFRFWTRVMKELGLVSIDEPVKRLITQGIVNGPDGKKMSKRWGNVVSPNTIIDRYGADTARLYVMFAGPPENDFDWSDKQVEGCSRFLGRVWKLVQAHLSSAGATFPAEVGPAANAIRKWSHKCLKRVTESMEKLSFNTAIAGVMETINGLNELPAASGPDVDAAWNEAVRVIATCLSPFAPHFADEVAEKYGVKESLQASAWPEYDPKLVVDDTLRYAVQVNGKLRGEVTVATGAGQPEVEALARGVEAVKAQLEGKAVKKVIFVPKRLINFVVA